MSKQHAGKFQYGDAPNFADVDQRFNPVVGPLTEHERADHDHEREDAAHLVSLLTLARLRTMLMNIAENLDLAAKHNMAPERVDAALALARLALEELR